MKTLKLKNKFQTNATLVANDFIDHYMTQANGEFVKVYLFLLRHLGDPCSTLTVSTIADCLNNTENDIIRAFRYWESEGLLLLEHDAEGRITGLELEKAPSLTCGKAADVQSAPVTAESTPAPAEQPSSDVPAAKAIPLNTFKAQKELKKLLFIAEQYMGKTLSTTEIDSITYFYDTLGMSAGLIEYLIESCVENGHKSIHYIQKVACAWNDEGITSVEQAKQRTAGYSKKCYTVLNAFGIKNRGPAGAELAYIRKWTDELGFSIDIVVEACSRTISATHQPSFEYADTILERWHRNQVHSLKDIAALDATFRQEKTAGKSAASKSKSTARNMNNFDRRNYDMDSLEEQLLNSN